MTGKNIIFCFDGTGAEPKSAEQPTTMLGGVKDTSISNVLKLHLLFGGDLKDGNAHGLPQLSLYYPGIGTYGSGIKRVLNSAFAYSDPDQIIDNAVSDMDRHYRKGDKVFVIGFSRGAALGRRFCAKLSGDDSVHKNVRVRLLICFDTVASIGKPDFSAENRPTSDVVFENRFIARNIDEALHCVSLDEKRLHFQPTLMNKDPRVMEIWFAGDHSDVGGGWWRDGLSDNVLSFVLTELERRDTGLMTIAPTQVKVNSLHDPSDPNSAEIDSDDLFIEPNTFGISHQQSPTWLPWLDDRRVVVVVKDQESAHTPLIHHTVVDRIYGDTDYRPTNLKQVQHDVLYTDQSTPVRYRGLSHHLVVGSRQMIALEEVGSSYTVTVFAHLKHNRTGVFLDKDALYEFAVTPPNKTWKDGGIECDANGWDRDHPDVNWIQDIGVGMVERFRRQPDANWFCLIGAIGEDESESFPIGKHAVYQAKTSGEFCPFANDLNRMYSNNNGYLKVHVTRIKPLKKRKTDDQ